MADDPRPIPATPETLAKVLGRRPVLWVGAGVSIAAGHPSTGALVEALIADADDPIDPGLSFEQVADAYVASQGSGALEDLLQRQFGASLPISELHHALARKAAEGAFAAIVTTNYDDLLERALGEAEARFVFQTLEDNAVVVDEQAAVRLLKLHGSRDDWQHAVLSGDAYVSFGQRYPFLEKQLEVLLKRHPVLFVGCSLQDPRIRTWLAALDDRAARRLKPWRALVTRRDWDAALAAGDALRRGNLRPLVLEDHAQLGRLWRSAAPPVPEPARRVLRLEVTEDGASARLGDGEPWPVEDLFADDGFVASVDELRELGSRPLPTDERGALAPAAASAAALLRERAAAVGERLTSALLPAPALEELRAATHLGRTGRPALLKLEVAADGGEAQARRADRWLALPWELLRVDGRFPVEDHSLDLVREAVVAELPGLEPPSRPLRIVATVASPVDSVELDHEGEMYRLWRALGAGDEQRLVVTDLGTLGDLVAAVEEHQPTVVHFTGHGRPGELLFEDQAACGKAVGVEELVRALRDAGPLPPTIYLSACHGTTVTGSPFDTSPGSPVREQEAGERASGGERMVEEAAVAATAPSTAASLHRGGFIQVVAYFGPVGDAQATRTSAAFYATLAGGATARAALRRARAQAARPLTGSDGRATAVYPLGWAQLALYHRGPDLPTALAAQPSSRLARGAGAPRKRIFRRLDREGGSIRVEGIEGVQQLRFGFIGRRRPRGDAVRRWRAGRRLLVVEGLGGLGKTALCAELLGILAGDCRVLALDGRWAGAQPQPLAALWQEVQAARDDEAWSAELAAQQHDGLTGVALARAVLALAVREKGLIVYLDDAESLQRSPEAGSSLGRWCDDDLRELWTTLIEHAVDDGSIGLIVSSRYRPEATPDEAMLPLAPMSHWEIVRLMTWTPTLRRLSQDDRVWLADRVDGHPRTVEYLEVLAREAEKALVPSGQRFTGDWRGEVLEPILEQAGDRLEADLLLPRVWLALDDEAREHLGRCTVLSAPAPWGVIRELEEAEGTGRQLVDAGLLSPFQAAGEPWWAPHRLVSETVAGLWDGDVAEAHRRVGRWFQAEFKEDRRIFVAQRAVEHLCAAGHGDEAWPTAETFVRMLRRLGRYREALAWVERVLAAQPTGFSKGIALVYEVQLSEFSGSPAEGGLAKLEEALSLVPQEGKGVILHGLGEHCQAIGRLEEAASYLEQAIEAKISYFGEEHTVVVTSLNALAWVLETQGNLDGARQMLERSLAILSSIHGTEAHLDLAKAMHDLARVRRELGDLSMARNMIERSLEIMSAEFGTEKHPFIATSLHTLAGVLQEQGDLLGAREKLERAIVIKLSVFGSEEHTEVAASLHELASVLKALGDLPGAREKLDRALAIYQRIFGDRDHYLAAITEVSLGTLLLEQEDAQSGVPLLAHAYGVFLNQLGPDHPNTQSLAPFFEQSTDNDGLSGGGS